MPELEWPHRYFIALVLMVIVGVLPYLFFNGKMAIVINLTRADEVIE